MYEGRRATPGFICDEWVYDDDCYDLRIFTEWDTQPVDKLSIIAEDVLRPHEVRLIERLDTPSINDIYALPEVARLLPEDWFDDVDNEFDCISSDAPFNENAFPGYAHVPSSKIGGWPSWVQWSEWPVDTLGNRLAFAGQIDWIHGENTGWCSGGYAYIFVERSPSPSRLARWLLQDT